MQPISLSSRLSAGMGMVSRRVQRGQRYGAHGHMSHGGAEESCIEEIRSSPIVLVPHVRKQSFEYYVDSVSTISIALMRPVGGLDAAN